MTRATHPPYHALIGVSAPVAVQSSMSRNAGVFPGSAVHSSWREDQDVEMCEQ